MDCFLIIYRKFVEKNEIPCSASDIQCPWIGPRDQFDQHLQSCSYEQIRPALEKLQTMNHHLQQRITNINERCEAQQVQINALMNMIQSSKSMFIARCSINRKLGLFRLFFSFRCYVNQSNTYVR